MKDLKIIIDTDIGTDIDDAYALALALRGHLEILGISTVTGNSVARGKLAKKMLLLEQQDEIPVFAGKASSTGMTCESWAKEIDENTIVQDTSAMIEFYWHAIEKNSNGSLCIVGIGPLSNIAAIRDHDPTSFDERVTLLIMGGSIRKGYLGIKIPFPEYNIFKDKVSARKIFESRASLNIVPLDVTADLKLDAPGLAKLESASGVDPLIKGLLDMTSLFRAKARRMPVLFDPGTIATLLDNEIGRFTSLILYVSRLGFTRIMKDTVQGAIEKHVCLAFNKTRFYDLFFSTLLGQDREIKAGLDHGENKGVS